LLSLHQPGEGLLNPAWIIPGDESPGYNGGHPLKRVQPSWPRRVARRKRPANQFAGWKGPNMLKHVGAWGSLLQQAWVISGADLNLRCLLGIPKFGARM